MNSDHIFAQLEFESAYKAYTEASNRIFNARTEQEKLEEREKFEKASERFNIAYQNLKDYEDDE